MFANAPTTNGLGKRNGAFSGWGMAAEKVEVLLVVSRLPHDLSMLSSGSEAFIR